MTTRRIRLGANEKIELEVVGEDERVYVLRGAIATRVEVLMGMRGGEVRATFVYDFAEVVEEGPRPAPERDARGKKRPAESYRQTPRSSTYESDFRRSGGTGDGWPNDMADDEHARNREADRANEEQRRREAEARERARRERDHYENVGKRAREDRERAEEERKRRAKNVEDFFRDVFGGDPFGFRPPPPRSSEPDWRELLGHPKTLADAKRAFKKLALVRHPDRGGTNEQMVELNAAMAAAERNLR